MYSITEDGTKSLPLLLDLYTGEGGLKAFLIPWEDGKGIGCSCRTGGEETMTHWGAFASEASWLG